MKIVEAREVIEQWSKKHGFRWQPAKAEALAKLLKQQVTKAEKDEMIRPKSAVK